MAVAVGRWCQGAGETKGRGCARGPVSSPSCGQPTPKGDKDSEVWWDMRFTPAELEGMMAAGMQAGARVRGLAETEHFFHLVDYDGVSVRDRRLVLGEAHGDTNLYTTSLQGCAAATKRNVGRASTASAAEKTQDPKSRLICLPIRTKPVTV